MNQRKKIIVLILMAILTAFSGCGFSGNQVQLLQPATTAINPETDVYSGTILYSSNRTDFQNTLYLEYIREFKLKYPNADVVVETVKDYQEAMRIRMASNDMPDVWTVHNGYYTRDELARFNIPLNDLAITKDFIESSYQDFRYNDNIYALPHGQTSTGLVYNRKLFKQLGLSPPDSLDALIAAGKKIRETGRIGLATAAKAKWPLQVYWYDVCKLLEDENAHNRMSDRDDPLTPDSGEVKAWLLLKRFQDEGILEINPLYSEWETMKESFRKGNIGMCILGNWFIPQTVGEDLTLNDVGFVPIPVDNNVGPKRVTIGPDVALAISKRTRSPKVAEAFYNFLMDTKYAEYAKVCGLMSARKSIQVDLSYVKEFLSIPQVQMPNVSDSEQLQSMLMKAQFDFNQIAWEILSGKSPDAIFTERNAQWNAARRQ